MISRQQGEETMKLRLTAAVVIVAIVGFIAVGAAGTTKPPKRAGKAVSKMAAPVKHPLPDWAPKKPSPEFLRASEVLKPESLESMKDPRLSGQAQQAAVAEKVRFYTDAYQLLGSLDDKQIQRYLTTREVRVPIKALTKKQRAAHDAYCKWDEIIVALYKLGAVKDLSNVEFGFADSTQGTMPNIGVRPTWWIRQRDGSEKVLFRSTIGWTYPVKPQPAAAGKR
jgi:hypothetical protein